MICLETSIPMEELARTLRDLMAKRDLQGVDLATSIGISQNALSAILTGKSTPRYSTFAKLRDRLAQTPEEKAMLTAAFEGEEYTLTDATPPGEMRVEVPPEVLDRPMAERAAHYMDAKAHSIEFRNDIQRLLDEARIPSNRDFIFEHMGRKYTCDFVTRSNKNRIVITAKSALNREWDLVLGMCLMLRRKMPANAVIVVVPYHNALSEEAKKDFAHDNIPVVRIDEMVATLKTLGA